MNPEMVLGDASDADACGALGCLESTALVVVESEGMRRVLCRWHARRLWS